MVVVLRFISMLVLLLVLCGCDNHASNDPYPNQPASGNILYSAFSEQPKNLDPVVSYSANEWALISQIYEPLLEYHYLKRPYQLQALIATQLPQVTYNAKTNISTYLINIKPGIFYQPHPALAVDTATGKYLFHELTLQQALAIRTLKDFKHTGTREVTAADFVYQIKRIADPRLNSPIFGFMANYIVGLADLNKQLATSLELRNIEFAGARVIDNYTLEINIIGKYPQFIYWLAMPFFSPIPWEATKFYNQAGLEEHNITLDWYPIGTGPYYLTENNPDRRMVMLRNPNYHPDYYPSEGEPDDLANGLLDLAGQKLPFIDKIIFSLEKENISYWDKFLQGYYDTSGISSDNFNSAINSSNQGSLELTQPLLDKKIRLEVSNMPSIFYWAFNMLDETVGGYSEQKQKLRKAISLAFDVTEYIAIFTNGRGTIANSPIPPEIFGYQAPDNHETSEKLQLAKTILAEAGYPEGKDPNTGQALQINFDAITSGDPDEKSRLAWTRKQLAKLGIELVIRATDYNRFMEKTSAGNAQMFAWGWNADYPDPENFLFMFYGPNGKAKFGGENAANYANSKFDELFVKIKTMQNSPQRLALIQQMLAILNKDTPWIWGYHPQSFVLYNTWHSKTKPSGVANNTLKYAKLDPDLRAKLRILWNKPLLWPLVILAGLLILIIAPAIIGYKRSENTIGKRTK